MQLKNKLGKVIALLAVVAISIGLFFVVKNYRQPNTKIHFTVLSHNAASIQTNPLEFASNLEKIADLSSNQVLVQGAKKMLEVDKNIALDQQTRKISEIFYSVNIEKLVMAICEVIGYEEKDPEEITEEFSKRCATTTLFDHFSLNKGLQYAKVLDKNLRTLGKALPAPIFYHQGFLEKIENFIVEYMQGYVKEIPQGYFTDFWVQELTRHLPMLYQKFMKDNSNNEGIVLQLGDKEFTLTPQECFIYTVINYFLLSQYIMAQIYETDGGMEAYLHIARHHHAMQENKDEELAKNYADIHHADVLTLQEARKGLIKRLCKVHDYVIDDTSKEILEGEAKDDFGSITLYKKSFIEKNNYTITRHYLATESMNPYREGIASRSFEKLFSNEVNINQLENEKHIILVVSFHAVSDGSNTLPFLQGICNLADSVKSKNKKPVYVILGMDANTSEKGTNGKADFQLIEDFINKVGYKIVDTQGDDKNTTQKKRSYIQLQIKKAGKELKERTDSLTVSHSMHILEAHLADYTELSDHREIVVTIEV